MKNSPGSQLRRIVNERRAVIVPGVMNALAARIAEDEGFEALYVTGAGVSNAYLGLPDVAFLTLTQLADHVAAIRNVTDLPLIVDGDTGFGNAVNTWHTVRTLERAGANAIQLEDQLFPKRCGHFEGKSVISSAEMSQKIASAAEARKDPDFMIIGRTDAYASEGLDGALERARAYIANGADITFVEAPKKIEDIARITGELGVPQLVNIVIGGKTPPMAQEELAKSGVGIVLYANTALQGAMLGIQKALSSLKAEGKMVENTEIVVSFKERQRLVAKNLVDGLEAKFTEQSE